MRPVGLFILVLSSILLASCGSKEVKQDRDGPSDRTLRPQDVTDARPRPEPLARYGNRSPYEVFGKKYYVMDSSEGYKKKGIASWYGKKFHGRRTSSGEIYDMHKATAAHKSLPLPTYAEVTNLDNGRKIVVKINDRGPFKDDRLIDLSYGAAVRLGMIATGTARVEVRTITFDQPQAKPAAVKVADGTFLQTGAFKRRDAAEALAGKLMNAHIQPVSIQRGSGLYRVWVGPFRSSAEIKDIVERVIELGLDRPHTVKR